MTAPSGLRSELMIHLRGQDNFEVADLAVQALYFKRQ